MKFNHLNVPNHWQNYWTRYPEGHTILEALISWVSQVDSMVDNQNKLTDNVEQFRNEIDDFVGRFDERLQDEVTQTLSEWHETGFLGDLINAVLKWQLDAYITTNEQDKLSLTAQLQKKIGYGVKAEPEDLSATTLGLLTGTGGPISIESIPQNYSVTPIKTNFLEENLSVGDTIQLITSPLGTFGDYYDPSTGVVANTEATQSYRPTAQIATLPFTTFKSFGVASWVYFNAEGTWVGKNAPPTVAQQATWVDLTVPEGAAYMIGNVKDQFFPIGDPNRSPYPQGVVSATYKELKYIIPKLIVSEDNLSSDIKNTLTGRFSTETIVNLGDSIIENKNPSVSDFIASDLGATVINGGFGGCMMSPHPNVQYAKFSMTSIADAIVSGNWSLQEGATGVPASFVNTVALLKSVNWLNVSVITISYGTNDWLNSNAIDDEANKLNKTTYLGALRYSVKSILQKYPHIKILVTTPIFRSTNDRSENSDNWKNGNQIYMKDYADALISAGKEIKIPVTDTFYGLGINAWNEGYYFPASDGTHPNEKGRKLLGQRIANEIRVTY